MNRKRTAILLIICLLLVFTSACNTNAPSGNSGTDTKIEFVYPDNDKDFSALRTPGSQEAAYEYQLFFLPETDSLSQPYVGDPMPYYEDGVFYLYYLKEAGDSYNHSIYLATTKDFLSFTEYDDPILEASRSGGQDGWVGTGSVVKVGEKYYLFYTGHASSNTYEFMEKIMVAEGTSPTSFKKVEGWELTPPAELGQKQDFRDPQCYYDAASDTIHMTVTASQGGKARVIKFSLSGDLKTSVYDGIIVTDPTETFWNLECSDTFRIGNKYYITYSGQDDTLWYAVSDTAYGPYSTPVRLEGKLFYAAKHVEDDGHCYMVGWARRSESPSSTQEVSAWGGNMVIQQVKQNTDGSLALEPVSSVAEAFTARRELVIKGTDLTMNAGSAYNYEEVFTAYERFVLKGEFSFTGKGSFGLAFDFNNRQDKYKLISVCPGEDKITLSFNEGSTFITESEVHLETGKKYSFTYLQEGSVGVFYIDGLAALTVRLYGVSGKTIRLFAETNNVEFTGLREYTK